MMYAIDSAQPATEPLFLPTLHQQLSRALGRGIGFSCKGIDGDPQALWPLEREAIQKAIPRRQHEFAAGRTAAREAMTQIGWPADAIPCASDRSPVWPRGLVGSIAHGGQVCVAIAGRRDQVHAMGIDIEEDRAIDPTLWQTICTPGELASVESLPQRERGRWVTRLFCAKEAYYKWQYPQTGKTLDFCDVDVTFSRNSACFSVRPAGKVPPLLCSREGHLLTSSDMVLAWLIGPPPASMPRDS